MRKNKQTQRWSAGDWFGIPLSDGSRLLGQVLSAEPVVLNSVSCALFDQRFQDVAPPPEVKCLFTALLTTRDLLDSGHWTVVGAGPIDVPRDRYPYESLRSSAFVGAKVIGSGNVAEFANAYCGLTPWDDWADPLYLDHLLISPDKKPAVVVYKNS